MSRETSRTRRPFKVWDSSRVTRKALVVSNLEELIVRGREKLGIGAHETVRIVLETDGTQVDDSEYYRSLPDNTVFLFLRPIDRWCPAGIDVIRAALSSIPRIVCEAISSLELQDEVPSWKIMESRGRITIILTWDRRSGPYFPPGSPIMETRQGAHPPNLQTTHRHESFARRISPSSLSPQSTFATPQFRPSRGDNYGVRTGAGQVYGLDRSSSSGIRTVLTKDGKYETVINDYGPPKPPTITVISHEEPPYDSVPRIRSGVPPPLPPHHCGPFAPPYQYRGLPRQGSSSLESGSGGVIAPVHVHTLECTQRGHVPQHPPHGAGGGRAGSPPEPSHCDFHCCALHEEGRKIQINKNVATSPIQEGDGSGRGAAKSLHVRFMGVGDDQNNRFLSGGNKGVPSSLLSVPLSVSGGSMIPSDDVGGTTTESSESETENQSLLEEEKVMTTKFLLLTDSQKRHLTIKDIGIILERLSSKIVDVERLARETEAEDSYLWTIKATIKGEVLRELGVIYNGNFYAISEHPNYCTPPEEASGGGAQTSSATGPSTSSAASGPDYPSTTLRRVTDDVEDMRL